MSQIMVLTLKKKKENIVFGNDNFTVTKCKFSGLGLVTLKGLKSTRSQLNNNVNTMSND